MFVYMTVFLPGLKSHDYRMSIFFLLILLFFLLKHPNIYLDL